MLEPKKQSKKQGIELYRFIMTAAICLHHFRLYAPTVLPYGGGYLAVDFFFILSGFFLYAHSRRHLAGNTLQALHNTVDYTVSRYKRLFPQYILTLLISIFVYIFILRSDMGTARAGAFISKILMLDGIYVHAQLSIMPQGWYCSVLLAVSALVYFLSIRYNQVFVKRIAPILAIAIYAALFFKYGHLNLYTQHGIILTVGFLRGAAGLCLGCALGNIMHKPVKIHIKQGWISIVLFTGLTGITLYALLWNSGFNKSDFLLLPVFVIILYYLLQDTVISNLLRLPLLGRLGRISYTMFLIHHLIAVLFDHYNWLRAADWKFTSVIYLAAVFICSLLLDTLIHTGSAIIKWAVHKNV